MSKTVIITGASGGIGSEIAHVFASEGWNTAIMYRNSESEAYELKNELENLGASVFCEKCDVADYKQVKAFVEKTEQMLGSADALVNNAGVALQKLFCDVTDEEYDNIFNTNVKGSFNCCKAVLPSMINNKSGKIVNVSSMWGICGSSCEVHYSASKAAVIGMTKALAKELGPSSINVNCVAPGLIDTKMNSNISSADVDSFIEEIPLMKIGKPADVAQLVYFLCSDKSDYITGQVFSVDGGMVI